VTHRRDELLVVRKRGQKLWRRKENIVKKADFVSMTAIAERLAQRNK
jgi:hypothetical protein